MKHNSRPTGMFAFASVWLGQMVSLFGTAMTRFALTIWAWQITGSATALALVGFFSFGPEVLLSPIAGALVDRWNRKLVMRLSDLAAGAFTGAFQSFQWPAYSAAISTMLPKAQYARANGMMSLAESGSGILAPLLAGLLIAVIGIGGILVIDVVTFVFAVGALAFVFIPQPPTTEDGRKGQGHLLQEASYGFRYILERP